MIGSVCSLTDEGAGQVGTSAYDPNGNLTDDGSQTYSSDQVIEERDGNWALLRRYVYGPGIDEPLSSYDAAGAKTCFYQRDGLGSVTEIVNDQGEVIERCRYSPYGKLGIYDSSWNELSGSSIGNPYFFTGREYDPESGLYYYRARMYSPVLGRFLQPDQIGYLGGMNMYQYVLNNSVTWTDSLGLDIWIEGATRGIEIGLHRSISIGDPDGEYKSFSLGIGPSWHILIPWREGKIYEDTHHGGKVIERFPTTRIQDNKAIDILTRMKDENKAYPYSLTTGNCRHFSQMMYEFLKDMFEKENENACK